MGKDPKWIDTQWQSRRCYSQGHREEGIGGAPKGEETTHAKVPGTCPIWINVKKVVRTGWWGSGRKSIGRKVERKPGRSQDGLTLYSKANGSRKGLNPQQTALCEVMSQAYVHVPFLPGSVTLGIDSDFNAPSPLIFLS